MKPTRLDAYRLLHEGALAFAEIEKNGIAIDVAYLDNAIRQADEDAARIKAKLEQDDIWKLWKKTFGAKANLGSKPQLATIIFDKLGYKSKSTTATGKYKADEQAFSGVKLPFVKRYFRREKVRKAKGTYLDGIRDETVDGYLHPFFNLHTVITYRSSSDRPNMQNQPARNDEMAELVRRCFIPREGNQFVEIDYAAIEVRIIACYSKDSVLLDYINDPTTDMHRDVAAQLFMLDTEQVHKQIRYVGKNQFVFPEFYGSYYVDCAKGVWEHGGKLMVDGVSVQDWLKGKGIKKLGKCDPDERPVKGTFEHHVKEVEEDFKHNRFKEHTAWRDDWWERYKRRGHLDTLTGFRLDGVYRRNQVVNSPIQGCLAGRSRVLTKTEGWVPIRELVGRCVKIWTGFKWADAIGVDRGECQRATIKLDSGLTVHCDTRHKMKNERDEWVDFNTLKIGDFVALPRIPAPLDYSGEMNWWFLFGFLIGDGCFSEKRGEVSIVGGMKKKPILKSIYHFLLAQGYRKHGYRSVKWKETPPQGKRKRKYNVSLDDYMFASFLKDHGFNFAWKAKTKRIPESVWRATRQQQRDFMEGLWLSDGGRNDRSLHMTSRKLLKDVQILTGILGFDSYLYHRPTETCEQTSSLCFTTRPTYKGSNTPRRFPIDAMHRLVKDVRKKRYEKSEYTAYVADHRVLRKGGNQYSSERVIEHNSTSDNPLIYRYDKIISIEVLDKKEVTYTMSVDDPLHQFVADGVIHKNSAFHCLLWSLIQLNKWLKKHKFKTRIVNQVHDSLLLDVAPKELDDVIARAKFISTEAIRKQWDWIITPLEVEVEVAGVGQSWFDKKKVD